MRTGNSRDRLRSAALWGVLVVLAGSNWASAADEIKVVKGLQNPESAAVGPKGQVFVTVIGERDKAGDGSVAVVDPSGSIRTFATGLDDPKGLVVVGDELYVADVTKVWKIDAKGKAEVYVAPRDFPRPPLYLNDIAADGKGSFYVSDSGDRAGKKGAIFRVDPRKTVELVVDAEAHSPPIMVPNGVLVDDDTHLFLADFGKGDLYRYDMASKTSTKLGGGFGGTDGIARDSKGRLFIGDWKNGKLFLLEAGKEPKLLSDQFQSAADCSLTADGKTLLVPDMKAGTLTFFPVP